MEWKEAPAGNAKAPLQKEAEPAGAKLTIETGIQAAPVSRTNNVPPPPQHKPQAAPAADTTVATATPKLGALHKIRKQVAQQNVQANDVVKPLMQQTLEEAWERYTEKLAEQKNHSAVTNFRLAKLRIADEKSFEIIVESNIQQKFVEQERAALVEHMQGFFNNKTLAYTIVVVEAPQETIVQERPMNSREQYLKMVEQYPLIKELRDRLKLELDY